MRDIQRRHEPDQQINHPVCLQYTTVDGGPNAILTTFLNDAEEGSLEEGGAETVSVGLGGLFIESNATQLPLHASTSHKDEERQ